MLKTLLILNNHNLIYYLFMVNCALSAKIQTDPRTTNVVLHFQNKQATQNSHFNALFQNRTKSSQSKAKVDSGTT